MSASPVQPDFSELARRQSDRAAIVDYIFRTPGVQESDFLEWKSGYDLTQKPGRAATSKHLIAFANRDFAQAGRNAEGFAYLLLGVEPGNLPGVPQWDSADIENWLSPYVGPDLRYGPPDYVTVGGAQVLFLVVDPPRTGDPIYSMQKAGAEQNGDTLAEGTIFVRRGGKSERHTSADLKRLTARANTTIATPLELSVTLDGTGILVVNPRLLTAAARDSYIERQEKRLLGSPPRRPTSPFDVGLSINAGVLEKRTEEQFAEEVRTYLADVEAGWVDMVNARHVQDEDGPLVAAIVNDTARNYEDVVLELTVPVAADRVFATPNEPRRRLGLPESPPTWGSLNPIDMAALSPPIINPAAALIRRPEVEAVGSTHALVRYPGIHVRPRSSHRLDRIHLALNPALAGTSAEVAWRVTSRSTDGDLSGTATLTVPA